MNINEKLARIQQSLKAPKNQYNKFGNFYYRSCEDILEAVKPLCFEVNTVPTLTDEVKEIGGRVYVVATAKLTDIEENTSVACCGFAREDESPKGMSPAQITGSCSSYARKYALNGLFCIDDSKIEAVPDPDTGSRTPDKVTSKQLADLQAMAKQKGVPIENIINGYKLNSLEDITPHDWASAMNGLRKRADKQ